MVSADTLGEIVVARYDPFTHSINITANRHSQTFTPEPVMTGSGDVALRGSDGRVALDRLVASALEEGITTVSQALNAL